MLQNDFIRLFHHIAITDRTAHLYHVAICAVKNVNHGDCIATITKSWTIFPKYSYIFVIKIFSVSSESP